METIFCTDCEKAVYMENLYRNTSYCKSCRKKRDIEYQREKKIRELKNQGEITRQRYQQMLGTRKPTKKNNRSKDFVSKKELMKELEKTKIQLEFLKKTPPEAPKGLVGFIAVVSICQLLGAGLIAMSFQVEINVFLRVFWWVLFVNWFLLYPRLKGKGNER